VNWVQPFKLRAWRAFFIVCGEIKQRKEVVGMKSGVIIYAAGEAPASWTEDKERAVKHSMSGVEFIEIITSRTGHFDVMDAWGSLKVRGAVYVECKMAEFTPNGELKETGRTLRLCG
jgi:hypothetical protein